MQCAYCKEQFTLLLTGSLDETQNREIQNHLANCPDCQMEFEATQKVWDLMGEMPKPSPSVSMRARFNAALNNYAKEIEANKKSMPDVKNIFQKFWLSRAQLQFVFGFILLSIGLVAGYLLNRPSQTAISYNRQIDSLSSQVLEMKQMMMLSLLENPSASQRIRAVGYTDEIGSMNKKVIDALLTTLNEDPNVNVRLMTLDALVKLSKEPTVREGLVQSITQQESPLVQSAIADVMVKLQEKKSVMPLQKLLHKKDLNEMVKLKIQQSIQKLI